MLLLQLVPLMAGGAGPAPAPGLPLVAIIDSGVARTTELKERLVREDDMALRPASPRFKPRYNHPWMMAAILARDAKRNLRIVSVRIDDPAKCPARAIRRPSPMRRP